MYSLIISFSPTITQIPPTACAPPAYTIIKMFGLLLKYDSDSDSDYSEHAVGQYVLSSVFGSSAVSLASSIRALKAAE